MKPLDHKAVAITIIAMVAFFFAVNATLGSPIASVATGWLGGCLGSLVHLTRIGLVEKNRREFLLYGVFLISISVGCSFLVSVMAAERQATLAVTYAADAKKALIESNRLEALTTALKDTFLLVSAALGANATFAGMTIPRKEQESL